MFGDLNTQDEWMSHEKLGNFTFEFIKIHRCFSQVQSMGSVCITAVYMYIYVYVCVYVCEV